MLVVEAGCTGRTATPRPSARSPRQTPISGSPNGRLNPMDIDTTLKDGVEISIVVES